jgi:hypothetical protein
MLDAFNVVCLAAEKTGVLCPEGALALRHDPASTLPSSCCAVRIAGLMTPGDYNLVALRLRTAMSDANVEDAIKACTDTQSCTMEAVGVQLRYVHMFTPASATSSKQVKNNTKKLMSIFVSG